MLDSPQTDEKLLDVNNIEVIYNHVILVLKGVSLSEEQIKYCQNEKQNSKSKDSLGYSLQDYRHENDTYNKIVSVGMFEHVGKPFYKKYFKNHPYNPLRTSPATHLPSHIRLQIHVYVRCTPTYVSHTQLRARK